MTNQKKGVRRVPFFNLFEAFYGKNLKRLWAKPINISTITFTEKL